jgi:multidrug efflux system membrane fusion protein
VVFSEEWSNSVVEAGEPDAFEPTSIDERILVRAVQSQAESRTIFLEVRGQTTANRTVQVMSEVTGKVVALPGEKGLLVSKGDLLCKVAEDVRRAEYGQTLAELESAQLEYDGFVDLNKKGLQSKIVLTKAWAALQQSKTKAENARLALMKTEIIVPFNGVVTSPQVEVGDYLSPGSVCVSLIETNPLLVAGQVAEKSIGLVEQSLQTDRRPADISRGRLARGTDGPDRPQQH